MNNYVIILAGGSGTRLWPFSRKSKPKQFLTIPPASRSLLQETIYRALELVPPSHVFVVGSEEHKALLFSQIIPISPKISIMLEPCSRNTLPAIMWACQRISLSSDTADEEIVVTVMPADHYVTNNSSFSHMCERAQKLCKNHFVLFGVDPTYPSTHYGYIKIGQNRGRYTEVKEFVEKPYEIIAKGYIKSGNYVWNSGIFTFNLQDLWRTFTDIGIKDSWIYKNITEQNYSMLKNISFDVGLLEKIQPDHIRLIKFKPQCKWSDLGTWKSMYVKAFWDKEAKDIREIGASIKQDSLSTMVWNHTNKPVVTVGVNNLVVIQEDDVTLICDKDKTHLIPIATKQIPEEMMQNGSSVNRPWGSYRVLHEASGYKVKEITVNPGQMLSLQSHKSRTETWTVVEGKGEAVMHNQKIALNVGESITINAGCKHRLSNPYSVVLKITEVQTGSYLGEDDITRYSDMYGRTK